MELYINDLKVDLNDRIPFPLTFHISDIRDIANRKGSSSKTVTLPGNITNEKLMSTVFTLSTTDIVGQSFTGNFDPSIKATARYYENGILQFYGICQLSDCKKINGVWSFDIVLFSDQVDIFTLLKNYKVRELGWSEYNHAFTYANQQNSWSGSIIKNGIAYNNYSGTDWLGEGYYYGLIDYGYDRYLPNSFEVTQIPPQIFVKSIVDKMFDKIDVTYDSTFFGTQQFKKILMAYEGGVLPEIDATLSTAQSVETDQLNTTASGDILDVSQTLSFHSTFGAFTDIWKLPFTSSQAFWTDYSSDSGTNVDPSGQIQSSEPFSFVASAQGDYLINYAGDHDVTIDYDVTGGTSPSYSDTETAKLIVKKNGVPIQFVTLWTNTVLNNTSLGDSHTYTASFDVDIPLNLAVSDLIEFEVKFILANVRVTDATATAISVDFNVQATNCALDFTYEQQTITAGSTINIKQFLPDMDCATFFKGLITMFNLYVKPDVTDAKKLQIEPLNSFYNGSNDALNWTHLVDYSKEFKVTPTVNFATKEYNFLFADDKDYWNDRYFKDVVEQYGGKQTLSSSQFSKGKTDFKLPFSNKLLGEIPETDLIVPRNFQVKTDEDGTSEIVERRGKPFIVQIKKGNVGTLQSGTWIHIDETDTSNNETEYGYVGHLDDIDSPSFDLMFDVPSYVFYDIPAGIDYTTNNLYQFHEKFIRELTDRHGKMLTCYINLDASIINTLDFGNLINIDGVVYRLQKISEYNSSNRQSTKCELIRLIEGESIQTYTIDTIPFDPYEIPGKRTTRITEDSLIRDLEDGLDFRLIE
jgi:hypothetical protein